MGQRCTWQAVSSITHTDNTYSPHTNTWAVLTPASLLGTALGPEGLPCRRMGVEASVEEEKEGVEVETGEREGWERVRETVMTLSSECHHGAKDPR